MKKSITIFAVVATLLPLGAAAQSDTTTVKTRTERLHDDIDSLRGVVRGRIMENRVARTADSILEARAERSRLKYDTLYIAKRRERWTFKVRANVSGSTLHTRGTLGGNDIDADMIANVNATLNVSAAYRGIGLGVSLNPMKLAGKNKDYEYNLNSYSNRYGFDVIYSSANTYHGHMDYNGRRQSVHSGQVGLDMLTVNGYYAFNHRRFSFPAAFSQSQVQLRSCGSWMLGATILYGDSKIKAGEDDAAQEGTTTTAASTTKIRMFDIAIGGGYAYNLVLRRGWMIHGSMIPELVVVSSSRMTVDGERQKAPFRIPNVTGVLRGAVVKNYKTNFMGASAVINTNILGDRDKLQIVNNKWMVRVFWGFHW